MAGAQDLLLSPSAVTSYCFVWRGVQRSREPVTALTARLGIRFILGALMAVLHGQRSRSGKPARTLNRLQRPEARPTAEV